MVPAFCREPAAGQGESVGGSRSINAITARAVGPAAEDSLMKPPEGRYRGRRWSGQPTGQRMPEVCKRYADQIRELHPEGRFQASL
jgi:hypothetical protein